MGARQVAAVLIGLNGLWAPHVLAAEQHAQLQVSATVVVTGTVDARLIARLRSAQSSAADSCAAVSLTATGPLPTRVTFHVPGAAQQMYRQVSLCPSAVLAMAQSYGGRSPAWVSGASAADSELSVIVEY